MANKIIFNVTNEYNNILLLKDNEITEYYKDRKEGNYVVGDIYLGRVVRFAPSMNAAFVDVGDERNGFLHYSDLSPSLKTVSSFIDKTLKKKQKIDMSSLTLAPLINKNGKINDVLKPNQKVIVQISKEVIKSKGVRISAEITLSGMYIVLIPFGNEVNVSASITDKEERHRLKQLISSILPANFGVVIRTAAKGKTVKPLNQDLQRLLKKWDNVLSALPKAEVSTKLLGEDRSVASIMKDLFDENCDQIIIDDKKTYQEIKAYLQKMLPEREKVIHLYKGKTPIFDYLNIRNKLNELLAPIVKIKGGGYIIIQQTDALWAIDVNTGNFILDEESQEDVALSVNLAAGQEVARQLRLRDIGGIIVIDFVGMKQPKNKKKVYDMMKTLMEEDPVRSDVYPLSKLCLMEITRSRVRPAIVSENTEICPSCYGQGKIQLAISLVGLLEEQLRLLLLKYKLRNITIRVHPYIYAYLHQGFLSKKRQWMLSYWQWIHIIPDDNFSVVEYQILNKHKEIVATNPKIKHPPAVAGS